jgi:hypothetical protein
MKTTALEDVPWIPTPTEIDSAGDALLEALIVCSHRGGEPLPGDLVEMSATSLDWERVGGYLLSGPFADPIEVWTVGRRIVRWHNARVRRVGSRAGPIRTLRSFPRPTPAELEEARRT